MSGAKKTIRVKTCSDDRIGCWDNRKCQLAKDFGLSVQEQPMHFQCIVVEFLYSISAAQPTEDSGWKPATDSW